MSDKYVPVVSLVNAKEGGGTVSVQPETMLFVCLCHVICGARDVERAP